MSNERTSDDRDPADPGESAPEPTRGPSSPPAAAAKRSERPSAVAAGTSRPPPDNDVGADEETLARELAEVQAESTRLRDQLLRTAADFDNFRKRSRREAEDAQRRGRESAIKELLPVFDNLERATQHADTAPEAKSVADGLRIVLKQFVDTLEKMGIRRVAAVGTAFDPSVHEAIQHVESADHPAGVIVAEVQPGYALGDHLLRASLVIVSKGPSEAATD